MVGRPTHERPPFLSRHVRRGEEQLGTGRSRAFFRSLMGLSGSRGLPVKATPSNDEYGVHVAGTS